MEEKLYKISESELRGLLILVSVNLSPQRMAELITGYGMEIVSKIGYKQYVKKSILSTMTISAQKTLLIYIQRIIRR